MRLAHVPPEHCIAGGVQLFAHVPLLQTCVPEQVMPQLPQLLLLNGTHWPLQSSNPAPHLQAPAWQDLPVPHLVPQAPQFWLSVWTLAHVPLQDIWPAPQVGPLGAGVAQPAATRARARQAKTDKTRLREVMTETPYVRASRG
jgi:hypothetical protein